MASIAGQWGSTNGGGAGCVLVVEDDAMQRRVIVRLLRAWGYETMEAADGGAAVEQVEQAADAIRLVVLDIMLPVCNGVEVARRAKSRRPQLPIVACSAAFDDEIEADLRGLGVGDFLRKPYDAESLRTTVARKALAGPG